MVKILLRRNASSGTTPTAGQLIEGELALNTADGTLFTKLTDGNVVAIAGGGGGGGTIDESNLVHKTGAESIAGPKTFTDPMVVQTAIPIIAHAVTLYDTVAGNVDLRIGRDDANYVSVSYVHGTKSLAMSAGTGYVYITGEEILWQKASGEYCWNLTATGDADLWKFSSTGQRQVARIARSWVDVTDATRKGRLVLSAFDWAGTREALRIEADGAVARIGFLGASAVARPSGDIGAALVALGLMTSPTGAMSPYRFGASGTITTGAKPPMHRVRAAGTATRLDMTLAAGTASATIEVSTDNGATWPTTIGPVSVASGKSGTATVSTSIPADALLRVNYTAATGASDPVVSLYLREA